LEMLMQQPWGTGVVWNKFQFSIGDADDVDMLLYLEFLSSVFQFSIGDAGLRCGVAPRRLSEVRFNSPLEMLSLLNQQQQAAAQQFQFSIGDANLMEALSSAFGKKAFQFSIGDAYTTQLRRYRRPSRFQFSIGDA